MRKKIALYQSFQLQTPQRQMQPETQNVVVEPITETAPAPAESEQQAKEDENPPASDQNPTEENTPTFSQEELDSHIQKRLSRERKKWEKEHNQKLSESVTAAVEEAKKTLTKEETTEEAKTDDSSVQRAVKKALASATQEFETIKSNLQKELEEKSTIVDELSSKLSGILEVRKQQDLQTSMRAAKIPDESIPYLLPALERLITWNDDENQFVVQSDTDDFISKPDGSPMSVHEYVTEVWAAQEGIRKFRSFVPGPTGQPTSPTGNFSADKSSSPVDHIKAGLKKSSSFKRK